MSNIGIELDKRERARVREIALKIDNGNFDAIEDLFISERVNEEFVKEKVLLHSFNLNTILSYLPYSDKIYVSICPSCIRPEDTENYKTLVSTNSIVPVLGTAYTNYSDEIVDFTSTRNHISVQEYTLIRNIFAGRDVGSRLCRHCLDIKTKSIKSIISRRESMSIPKKGLPTILQNLNPYVEPDFQLLDDYYDALKRRDEQASREIVELSWTVRNMRSAQVFRSPLILNGDHHLGLPNGYNEALDAASNSAAAMHKRLADGLGLQLPSGISLEAYIEISSDFRPRIRNLMGKISTTTDLTLESAMLNREIMRLNDEVGRVQHSGRFVALSACVDFYKKNQTLVNATLVAGALGLANGIAGCAAGAATAVAGVAKQKGLVVGGPAIERMERKISNVIRPHLDNLVAKYLGASEMAVSVVALKQDLSRQHGSN